MRLSEWQARAPYRDSVAEKVLAPARDALELLGAERDPDCWISWGDDPQARWAVLVPAAAGLNQVNVRVNVPGEGPRAAGKLTRWHRVQIGELSSEIQGGHRIITFQVEQTLLHGADAEADAVGSFAEQLFAAMDGRQLPAKSGDVIERSAPKASDS